MILTAIVWAFWLTHWLYLLDLPLANPLVLAHELQKLWGRIMWLWMRTNWTYSFSAILAPGELLLEYLDPAGRSPALGFWIISTAQLIQGSPLDLLSLCLFRAIPCWSSSQPAGRGCRVTLASLTADIRDCSETLCWVCARASDLASSYLSLVTA